VFAALLDGQVSDLELGAFLMAMRIKAESVDELIGFVQACEQRCIPLAVPEHPLIVLPSYNGSRRLPNLTALLAGLLAQHGIPVLVHGPLRDPKRVSTAEVFDSLSWPHIQPSSAAAMCWPVAKPVFGSIETLCPSLARLLALRWVLGVRSSGHSVAKLLNPCTGALSLRVVNYTHPEYTGTLSEMLTTSGAHAMLLRGTEGEPVADGRRLPRMDMFLHGALQADLSVPLQEGSLATLPDLPTSVDADSTARYIKSVLSAQCPVPAPIQKQTDLLHAAWLRLKNVQALHAAV
jgi:anthranilate phosphoribosyltransferase